jgi:hypothetical protein
VRIKIAIVSLIGIAFIGGLLYWRQGRSAANQPTATDSTATAVAKPSTLLPTATVGPTTAAATLTSPSTATVPSDSSTGVVALSTIEATSSPEIEPISSLSPTLAPANTQPPAATQAIEPAIVLPSPTLNPTRGVIGPPPTPPGRLAPDTSSGQLQFQQIRIFADAATGNFSGRANVTNTSQTFLNGIVISWRILDSAGQSIDQGQTSWPNLAPGETASIPLNGSAPYLDTWARVEFAYQG